MRQNMNNLFLTCSLIMDRYYRARVGFEFLIAVAMKSSVLWDYNAVSFGKSQRTFRRDTMSEYSCSKRKSSKKPT
jgi:hypothetical protein